MRRFALLLLIFACSSAAGQEFDYDAYRPILLADVPAELPQHSAEWLAEGQSRFRTQVVFTGHFRPLSTRRKLFIGKWFAAMNYPATDAAVFEQEVEVTQGGTVYRMPIQAVLVDQLKSEAPAGSSVELYFVLMGSENKELVFAVSEFDAKEDVHAPAEAEPSPVPTGEAQNN